jgi:hypothetical protein
VLPNLLVIGGMKCGTSSLHYYLSLHPEIFMSETKELSFFSDHWRRGLEWYERQFPVDVPVRGESSPNYTKYPAYPGVPERAAEAVPEAKLVYLVRDPISRIVSHYVDAVSWGRETAALDDALAEPEGNHYVNCSRYAMQLERWLAWYPLSHVLVITAEDLKRKRAETLRRVYRFVGVDESFTSPEHERVLNTAAGRRKRNALGRALTRAAGRLDPTGLAASIERPRAGRLLDAYIALTTTGVPVPGIGAEAQERLAAFLGPDVARLTELTGVDTSPWTIPAARIPESSATRTANVVSQPLR